MPKKIDSEFTLEPEKIPDTVRMGLQKPLYNNIIEKALASPTGEYKLTVPDSYRLPNVLQCLNKRIYEYDKKGKQGKKKIEPLSVFLRQNNLWIRVEKRE